MTSADDLLMHQTCAKFTLKDNVIRRSFHNVWNGFVLLSKITMPSMYSIVYSK